MELHESIGRYNIRKVIRFSITPTYHCAAVSIPALIAEDEQRAAFLNTAKAAIEAEHLTMVRRVFKALPNPLPDVPAIRRAFESDPEYGALSGRNVSNVMRLIVERCRYNGWPLPIPIKDLEHWPSLYVKWHWHCSDRLRLTGENSIPRQWAGRPKDEIERTCPLLRTPKKRKPSRNYWFDHSPFRIMFGNQTCGMSWCKKDFPASRTFILLDGDRILVGVVPRQSKFCPYTIPDPQPGEPTYRLYEEERGERPTLRPIPRSRIDLPAKRGFLLLFELGGRALRGKGNLSASYLRALFSDENLQDPVFHLEGNAEFHICKGVDLPQEAKPERFRQRFTEDRLFITLHLTLNAHMVATGKPQQPFADLNQFLAANPLAHFLTVSQSPNKTYTITSQTPQTFSSPSSLVGALARQVVAEDAFVVFTKRFPKKVRDAVADKFAYVVLKGRDRLADGGVLRGYQLKDRLFIGDLQEKKKELEAMRAKLKAEEAARLVKARRKAENRAKADEQRRLAVLRRSPVPPDLTTEFFQTGQLRFKVEFKTSDNACHTAECRADSRDEMFSKARTVGIRPSRVTCLDPMPVSSGTSGAGAAIAPSDIAARLKRLEALKSQGLLSESEYADQRSRILAEL